MRGIYFNTNNNTYFYNDETGEIKREQIRRKDEYVSDDFVDVTESNVGLSREAINFEIQTMGFSQLTLVLTESCNIRCKYCIYSGVYDNSRTHQMENYMTDEIAQKSCDKYMDYFRNKNKFLPLRVPTIGFYGGEPLLNFDVLKNTVNYVNKKYSGVQYTISTNGMLLNDEYIDFLLDNDFIIAISMNGDKKENDRLRVDINGDGTFDVILNNINRIVAMMKKKNKELPILLLATIDTGTDLVNFKKFFDEIEKEDNTVRLARVSGVFADYTDWYSQYSDSDVDIYNSRLHNLKLEYYKNIKNNIKPTIFDNLIFGLNHKKIINRLNNVKSCEGKSKCIRKTGTCMPFTKISADYKGDFHVCEKMNSSRSIGNCFEGINFKSVEEMIGDYNVSILDCQKCSIERLCEFCYVNNVSLDGTFNKPNTKLCKRNKINILNNLKDVYELLEDGVDLNEYYFGGV